MGVLRVVQFGGRVPRLADRLLPPNAAQAAFNTNLDSGEVRAFRASKVLATLPLRGARSAYRFEHEGQIHTAAFDRFARVVKAPLVNDAHGRIYWSTDRGFFMNTKARVVAGEPPVKLGVPAPQIPSLAVQADGGSSVLQETRAYVVTLISAYGEESAPSAPVTASGPINAVWTLTGLDTLSFDTVAYPQVKSAAIYRTITSSSGVDYRRVGEIQLDAMPASYADEVRLSDLASAPVLESLAWTPPPEGLRGVVGVSGGFLAGFKGRTVYLSEPYYPHAWPEDYQLAVEDDIVALGTYYNTIVVLTKGKLWRIVGPVPSAMSLGKVDKILPCLSAEGAVSGEGFVVYPSTEGLVSVSDNGEQVITQSHVTTIEWQSYRPERMRGALMGSKYFGLYTDSLGFLFGATDPITGWVDVQVETTRGISNDALTGRVVHVVGNTLCEFDGEDEPPTVYNWRSRRFILPRPQNFGAYQLRGDFHLVTQAQTTPTPLQAGGFELNSHTINAEPATNGPGTTPNRNRYEGVEMRLYADGELVHTALVRDEGIGRLPSGFKSTHVEVELTGSIPVYSLALGTTAKAFSEAE